MGGVHDMGCLITGFFKKKERDRETNSLWSILAWKLLIYFGLFAVLPVMYRLNCFHYSKFPSNRG